MNDSGWKELLKAERERRANERAEYLEWVADRDREDEHDRWLHDAYDRAGDR